jgi:hypothetical protein
MAILRHPSPAAGAVGDIVQFKVVSDNDSSTYLWQYSTDGETWNAYAGEDASSNAIAVTLKASDNGKQFRCVVDETPSDPATTIILSSDYSNKLVKGAEFFLALRDVFKKTASLEAISHYFSNADILDQVTAAFTTALKNKLDGIEEGATNTVVDASLIAESTNPVQSQVIQTALAGKAAADHTHTYSDVGADAAGAAAQALSDAQTYTDNAISALVNGAGESLDTLKELADALDNDADFATTITNLISQKADGDDLEDLLNKFTNTAAQGEDADYSEYAGNAATASKAVKATKLYTVTGEPGSEVETDAAVGGATQGVYFVNGVPTVMTYQLNKTVPADAVFTDTMTEVVTASADDNNQAYDIAAITDATDGKLVQVAKGVAGKEFKFNPVTGVVTADTFDGKATKDGSGNVITTTYATKSQTVSEIASTAGNTLTLTYAGGITDTVTLTEMTGASDSANGASGIVPGPVLGDEGKFLRGDGTWADIPQQVEVMNNAEFNDLLYNAKNA